jgi:hypothetical protein
VRHGRLYDDGTEVQRQKAWSKTAELGTRPDESYLPLVILHFSFSIERLIYSRMESPVDRSNSRLVVLIVGF